MIYKNIVINKCSMSGTCHDGSTSTVHGGGLDLYNNGGMAGPTGTNPGRAWKNLVMQAPKDPAMYPQAMPPYQCYMKGQRVVAGDAAKSIVYSKLIGMPICGANAPEGAPDGGMETWMRLSDAELCMWKTWINAGAQQN